MKRGQDISLNLQSGTVMLCFLLVVGTLSSLGYQGSQTLATIQDRVRQLTSAQTAIQDAERAMLARELALIQALALSTVASRERLDASNHRAINGIQDLLRLSILDQENLADVLSVQVATSRWMEAKGRLLLNRFRTAKTKDERAQLLMDYAAGWATEQPGITQQASLDKLSEDVLQKLDTARAERDAAMKSMRRVSLLAAVLMTLAAVVAFLILHFRINAPIRRFSRVMYQLANDDLSVAIPFRDRVDEIGAMSRALMVFRNIAIAQNDDLQVKRALANLSNAVQEQQSLQGFASVSVRALAQNLGATVGCFHAYDEVSERLTLFATYGYSDQGRAQNSFRLGEGQVGQVARDRKMIMLSPVPQDYIKVSSGLGSADPGLVLIVPVLVLDRLVGVLEFGTFEPFDTVRRRIIDEAASAVALPLENLKRAVDTRRLLEQSRRQTEELQAAEEELRAQQNELEAANAELACRGEQLETSREEALARAEELEQTSQYKSRFLANMSHELRTPLNSMLILAQDLSENSHGNLDPQQIEAAKVIHTSGISLLRLINEILDLSKIEAGKVEMVREQMSLGSLCQTLERTFRQTAAHKGISLSVTLDPRLPATVYTDPGRLEQIANNLIGNALKFTHEGSVKVVLSLAEGGKALSFAVTDTGIGIPVNKLNSIFQPFEQVDASTQRQFGGTGLGLAISNQLAVLLGGQLTVESVLDQGSVFTLNLPIVKADTRDNVRETMPPAGLAPARPTSDRHRGTSHNTVLVVEDDIGSQLAISQLLSRNGISVVSALTAEDALDHTERQEFGCIILDLGLPSLSGFEMLDLLVQRGKTMPVVIYSARDMLPEEVLRLREHTDSIILKGERSEKRLLEEVCEFLQLIAPPALPSGTAQMKALVPVSAPAAMIPTQAPEAAAPPPSDASQTIDCKLLLVDDDMRNIYALAKVLRGRGMEVVLAQDGLKALSELEANPDVQIVLMDMMMPNMDGYEAMREIRKLSDHRAKLPIIALTAKAMKEDRDRCIEAGATDYMAKPINVPLLLAMIRELLAHEI